PVRKLIILVASLATIAAAAVAVAASGASDKTYTSFDLKPNPKFIHCLAKYPDDPSRPPTARVDVVKGDLNDTLVLHARNIKPNLTFDLFTVQRSTVDANGVAIQPPPSFGLAWYQSDVQADDHGRADVKIRTIIADQIFGVNVDQSPPNPI